MHCSQKQSKAQRASLDLDPSQSTSYCHLTELQVVSSVIVHSLSTEPQEDHVNHPSNVRVSKVVTMTSGVPKTRESGVSSPLRAEPLPTVSHMPHLQPRHNTEAHNNIRPKCCHVWLAATWAFPSTVSHPLHLANLLRPCSSSLNSENKEEKYIFKR